MHEQIPPQSAPPAAGSQLSFGSSTHLPRPGQAIPAIPPQRAGPGAHLPVAGSQSLPVGQSTAAHRPGLQSLVRVLLEELRGGPRLGGKLDERVRRGQRLRRAAIGPRRHQLGDGDQAGPGAQHRQEARGVSAGGLRPRRVEHHPLAREVHRGRRRVPEERLVPAGAANQGPALRRRLLAHVVAERREGDGRRRRGRRRDRTHVTLDLLDVVQRRAVAAADKSQGREPHKRRKMATSEACSVNGHGNLHHG